MVLGGLEVLQLCCAFSAVVCARRPLFRQQPSPKNKSEQCGFVFWGCTLTVYLVCRSPYWDAKITWTFASSDPRLQGKYLYFTFTLHEDFEGKLPACQTVAGIPFVK